MENHFDYFYSSTGICTDTRNITKDCLFICIKGDNFDGNNFAKKALEQGAKYVIVDNKEYFDESKNMILVDDSVLYLQNLANFHRKKFDIPVIGITGSNGKTTTKELIQTVLSKKLNVLATIGNLNNHLGVPFTLLRLTKEHEVAIIEMGANKFKDIEELCKIAEPTHGIITNIGKAHLEGFINIEGVIRTKKELYQSVEENAGEIFYNSEDKILSEILPKTTINHSYGKENSDIVGELVRLSPFVEMKWNNITYNSSVLKLKMVGEYNFYNYLAAVSFGVRFGVKNEHISEALIEYTPSNSRSQVKKTEKNTLILDCYNANPTSMKSALDSFAMIENNNKICVLGDMRELGKESSVEHSKIIEQIETLDLQAFIVGEEFFKENSCNILQKFKTINELHDFLTLFPIQDKLVLLKGSRGIQLEKIEELL